MESVCVMSYKSYSTKLKSLRENNGLSLDELSKITGIKKETLIKYETGEVKARLKTFSKIVDKIKENRKEFYNSSDKDEENVNDLNNGVYDNTSSNSFNSYSYKLCCDKLLNNCGKFLRELSDNGLGNECLPIIQDIDNLSHSLYFIFHRSSIYSGVFDETLIAYTVKHTIGEIIDSFNSLKSVSDLLNKNASNDTLVCNLRLHIRQTLHNIRYVFFYINDYFKVQSDMLFIIERDNGTVCSLNDFHEKRMSESF